MDSMNIAAIIIVILLQNIVDSAKILIVTTVPSVSHQKPFLNLGRELSLRGHEITLITTNPLNDKSLTNLTEINISRLYDIVKNYKFDKILSTEISPWITVISMRNLLNVLAIAIFETEDVSYLINSNRTYDLVIAETLDPIFTALGSKFNVPLIGEYKLMKSVV